MSITTIDPDPDFLALYIEGLGHTLIVTNHVDGNWVKRIHQHVYRRVGVDWCHKIRINITNDDRAIFYALTKFSMEMRGRGWNRVEHFIGFEFTRRGKTDDVVSEVLTKWELIKPEPEIVPFP